ncbi:MAG: alkaline phosphatase family protein [Candidatus Electryonea clarkiae]|nr:alkaline phosphatase family protein [Candidatus Electryonea clarkiae]MDP8287460.1 alkaline phosphatase family protein [Candidatus Electryonea clarkiae]
MSEYKPKVLFVGIDAADPDYIDRRISEGALPNIAALRRDGVWGRLRSTFPVLSSAAWSTIATGLPPEKHGIYEFFRRKPGTWQDEPIHGGMKKGDDFWQIASINGYSTVVINMPITYPPQPISNGVVVSGMDTPGKGVNFVSPHEERNMLLKEVPDYRIEQTAAQFDTIKNFLDATSQMMKERKKAALYLFRKHQPDLAVVVFTALDRVLHALWKHVDPNHPAYERAEAEKWRQWVDNLYDEVDDHLGELIEWAGPDAITVMSSDHGSAAVHGVFYINRWLIQEGYLSLHKAGGKDFAMKTGVQLQQWVKLNVPKPVKNIFNKLAPQLYTNIETRHGLSRIDSSKTYLYAWRKTDVMRLNLAGREPGGIVNPGAEAEAVLEEVKAKLESITDDRKSSDKSQSGYKPVRKVWTRKEAYPLAGELDDCPDMVIEWGDRLYSVDTTFDNPDGALFSSEEKPDKPWREEINGDHALYGVFGVRGKGIEKGVDFGKLDILSVAPTVLAALKIGKPASMPGNVPQGLFEDSVEFDAESAESKQEPDHENSEDISEKNPAEVYTEEEREIIEKRLRDLGYM